LILTAGLPNPTYYFLAAYLRALLTKAFADLLFLLPAFFPLINLLNDLDFFPFNASFFAAFLAAL